MAAPSWDELISRSNRGALRRGLTRDDVEALHEAIEEVCEACGSRGVREGMPRLEEVERQKEEAD